MISPKTHSPYGKESRKLKPHIKCPDCFCTDFWKYGKDRYGNQKYMCKSCFKQYTLEISTKTRESKSGYPKCPVCGNGMYLHHKYKNHVSFKCNSKKCNHTIKRIIPESIEDPSSEKLRRRNLRKIFSGYRFNLHTIIMSISMYYSLKASTRAISTFLFDYMNIKVSHVTISKWIKTFDIYFKTIGDELSKDLYLGDSDEWHADETIVKIAGEKFYLWVCIDSETRFVLSWNLNKSRGSDCAFSLFKKASAFGSPKSIVTDGLKSYEEAIKYTFYGSEHIVVENFSDYISNNVIEAFNETFKAWYNNLKGFKEELSANSIISNFIFYYNFIRKHSSLNNLTPAEVCGIKCSHQEKVNWFINH